MLVDQVLDHLVRFVGIVVESNAQINHAFLLQIQELGLEQQRVLVRASEKNQILGM